MESPDNRKLSCFDIFKQYSYMDIKAMEVVEVKKIRLDLIKPLKKPFGYRFGAETAFPEKKIDKHMGDEVKGIADFVALDLVRGVSPAVSDE